jgi:hypothetical protein
MPRIRQLASPQPAKRRIFQPFYAIGHTDLDAPASGRGAGSFFYPQMSQITPDSF